jgi:hypothetical protein
MTVEFEMGQKYQTLYMNTFVHLYLTVFGLST